MILEICLTVELNLLLFSYIDYDDDTYSFYIYNFFIMNLAIIFLYNLYIWLIFIQFIRIINTI